MTLRIGLDLDNTLIRYDRAFSAAAELKGLIPAGFRGSKQDIRDHVRARHPQEGETRWQALQGYVYGKGITEAELFPGVLDFLAQAKQDGAQLFIVSHKTRYGHFDDDRVDLRDAARNFLRTQKVTDYVPEENISFWATRSEKIRKILSLGCDVFVDDLEEVLFDPDFTGPVRKILFTERQADHAGALTCADWQAIRHCVFEADPQA